MAAEEREFKVQLTVTSSHEYEVVARTSEEAVSIAEDLFEEEDFGVRIGHDVDSADAYPLDEECDDDAEEEEED